jgi:CBS domain containing-hemolysin-like protein
LSTLWAEWLLLIVCTVLSALASGTETAMTSVGRIRIRHLAEEGSRRAAILARLHQDPNRFLSTVLIVNTVALIVAGSTATLIGTETLPHQWGLAGDLGVSLLLSVFLLIFAEVTPKTLAIRNAERISLWAAVPVNWLSNVLRPVIWFITIVARLLTGGRGAHTPFVTEEELLTILSVSEEQGVIEEDEREMIHGIIEIGDKSVREVMVPRPDVTAVERAVTLDELVKVFAQYKHTRVPVYEGDIDHMVGLIHIKDLVMYYARGAKNFEISRMMRRIESTPESKKVDELLHEMQTKKVHMMVVVDEYGGTAGIVTLEDVLEEIVGEIRDEYDISEEEPVRLLNNCEALVDARYPMDELNERLKLGIEESHDYDSVGGYVMEQLGAVPKAGQTFEVDGVKWTVDEMNGQRIVRVRLASERPWPDEMLVDAGIPPPSRDESDRSATTGG